MVRGAVDEVSPDGKASLLLLLPTVLSIPSLMIPSFIHFPHSHSKIHKFPALSQIPLL